MKKNITNYVLIGITMVLGGIGIFTATKLYQLRNQGVTPNAPESHPGAEDFRIGVINTNSVFFDEITFVNNSGTDQNMDFLRDSWDDNSLDQTITNVFVKNGESYTVKAFPGICTKFQVDARFSNDVATKGNDFWERGWIVESTNNPNCKSTPTGSPTDTPTSTPTTAPNSCTLSFSLEGTGTPTGTPTSTPTSTPTDTPTSTPTSTPTDTPTSTPTNSPTSTPTGTSTATPVPQLPNSGSGIFTMIGVAGGTILILLAVALAL